MAGWSYSWTAPMDARRIPPTADATDVTVSQVRDLVARLGETATTPVFCFDAGYDPIALTAALTDVTANIVVRVRDDRVFYTDPTPPAAGTRGRPRRHGRRLGCADPESWPGPDEEVTTTDSRYGTVHAAAWHALHPKLGRRGRWTDRDQPPIVRGTVIRVDVEHLPKPTSRTKKTLWLWVAGPGFDLDIRWRAYLRRFDIEHTFGVRQEHPGLDHPIPAHPRTGVTAGPGSSSPPTPSSASPEASSTTSGCHENDDANPADSPPHGSDEDLVDLPRHWARQSVHQNLEHPAPDAQRGPAGSNEPATQPSRRPHSRV